MADPGRSAELWKLAGCRVRSAGAVSRPARASTTGARSPRRDRNDARLPSAQRGRPGIFVSLDRWIGRDRVVGWKHARLPSAQRGRPASTTAQRGRRVSAGHVDRTIGREYYRQ